MTPLAHAILRELAGEPGGALSLPRLGKRLGQGASVLMRALSGMGTAAMGGVAGPGWVRVEMEEGEGRWRAVLTDAGRAYCVELGAQDGGAA
ncbi:hypothetical protein PY257_05550 [Ramlibacter sp. H39-3-26]|uniref:hypothetical protein n=1 Tax=Curvibacter soli TaxID=3031331 RepID=UPI0023DA1F3F|nr:hypothetical protein [Ramlibacter sp. H39-3-26]MDF1484654.1 hypothetical protein [Ramlibacter sp. H39-3-26]